MNGREAFEAWAKTENLDIFIRSGKSWKYEDRETNIAWMGWDACNDVRDAEIAAKDARIAELEQALRELPDVVPRTARGEITVRVVREYIEEALR